tara:strand:- start:1038 stop:1226 length:189 start_codon:yes stop_codon:yes gene_type:complete
MKTKIKWTLTDFRNQIIAEKGLVKNSLFFWSDPQGRGWSLDDILKATTKDGKRLGIMHMKKR